MASNQERPYTDKQWLREKYVADDQNTSEIADVCNVTNETILNWLEKHGIRDREAWESNQMACENCGDVFKYPPSREGRKKYCSKECFNDSKREKVQWECEWCGETVTSIPSQKGEFCSQECWVNFKQETKPTKDCQYCGGTFTYYECLEDQVKYCSVDCMDMDHREVVNCDNCGEEMARRQSIVEKNDRNFCDVPCAGEWRSRNWTGPDATNFDSVEMECTYCGDAFWEQKHREDRADNPFCSMECREEWWSETGYADGYYGPDWPYIREVAKEKDDYKCQSCGGGEKLEVHHIHPLREYDSVKKAHKLQNLVTLCESCHPKWEGINLRPTLL